jgi:hypothetical protein
VAERACAERSKCVPNGDVELILRVSRVVDEVGVDVMRKRLIPAFILIAYSAILIKLIVFKTQRPLRIKLLHLQLKFTDHGTGHANFLPFKTIWPYLHGHPISLGHDISRAAQFAKNNRLNNLNFEFGGTAVED